MAKERYVAYVGTYTHENSVGIHVYDIDVEEGKLTERSVAPINNPSYLTVSNDGRFLYAIEDEGVASFRIDENGDLEKMNQAWIGGMRGCFVKTDKNNRYLFVGGFHDGRVTMMHLNKDGSIGDIADGIFHQGMGRSTVEKRLNPRVTCVRLTPDERYLCAVDLGLNQIKVYAIDYERGKLQLEDIVRFHLESGPRRLKFSRDGKFAYVITEQSNKIHVFSYNYSKKDGPVFERIQKIRVLEEDYGILSACDISFTSDDKYIFASMDGVNAISCFRRDEKTGLLTFVSYFMVSGDYPKSLAVLPGDQYILSLNHDSNTMSTFHINHEKECFLMKNAPIKVETPNCIQIHKLT